MLMKSVNINVWTVFKVACIRNYVTFPVLSKVGEKVSLLSDSF